MPTKVNTISGPDTITAKGWYKYTTTDAGQWSTSGDSFKYLEENGNELSFYVDEDVYESHVAIIYCNVISTGENLTKEVTVNKTAAEAPVDVQAKITTEYPVTILNPFRSAKLKLSAAGSVGLTSTMKLKWSVDSGQMFKTYETAHDVVTEVTVSDLLNGFKPQGSVPVSVTLEIIDSCVVSRAQTMLVMCDVLPDPNTKWTPNYNGVNSYVEIPEWKPSGEFEIEMDVYISGTARGDILGFGGGSKLITTQPGKIYIGSDFTVAQVDGVDIPKGTYYEVGAGFHKIRAVCSSADVGSSKVGWQGEAEYYFKGQISNLKLIDKKNPSNSRFYPGIIYSYVDPDATDVPMPDSTVLVDEWCEGEDIQNNTGTASSWSKSGDVWTREDVPGWGNLRIIATEKEGTVITVEVREISDGVRLYIPKKDTGNTIIQVSPNTPVTIQLQKDSYIWFDKAGGTARVAGIKVTKVTHGIMTNFGTDAPWVQLLSDDSVTFEEMNEEVQAEPKLYTVFNYPKSLAAPYTLSEEGSEELVQPPYLVSPNVPRLSLDGSKGIVTDIYGEAPECIHLSQTEAEELMQTKEWSLPEE